MNTISIFQPFFTICLHQKYTASAWQKPEIVPLDSVTINPSCIALHYSQSVFEGALAVRQLDGGIALFRFADNLNRLNRSAKRLCMPQVDTSVLFAGVETLLKRLDTEISKEPGTLIYIRPLYYATDSQNLGVRISYDYSLVIELCPINNAARHQPETLLLNSFPRSFPLGTGDVKAAANYSPTLLPKDEAKKAGYSNLLFPDATNMFVEECCANNIFFFIGKDTVYTPTTKHGTILPGITRDSVIKILLDIGYDVIDNEQIRISTLRQWTDQGLYRCAFTTGTAGGICLVTRLKLGNDVLISDPKTTIVSEVRDILTSFQTGKGIDYYQWMHKINTVNA